MKVGIMQPYFFPYIGYFQLLNAVDKFVVYDNIQFTKKGWINRNRVLVNAKDDYITLPIKKDSDYLNVDQRQLADTFHEEEIKMLRKLSGGYSRAPYFSEVFPLLQTIIESREQNLFRYLYNTITAISSYLEIDTEFIVSSSIQINHNLKSQDKVLAICKALHATVYLNPIGGIDLYNKDIFKENNIELNFIQSEKIEYPQYKNEFVPWLSIVDVLMFNSKENVKQYLNSYKLV